MILTPIFDLLISKQVAEKIMDPFGDDEHDFDMNVIVDRNWQVTNYITLIHSLNMAVRRAQI